MDRLDLKRVRSVAGTHYKTPKEIWGFRAPTGKGRFAAVARQFLHVNEALLGLEEQVSALSARQVRRSLGAQHAIFSQTHFERPIFRAYVTVHASTAGEIYLIKNRAMPRTLLATRWERRIADRAAHTRARRAVTRSAPLRVSGPLEVWFPRRTTLQPALKLRVRRDSPPQEWIVYLHAVTGAVLSRWDNLSSATRRARYRGTALVFDPNPIFSAPRGWQPLDARNVLQRPPLAAHLPVVLGHLSRATTLDGKRVSTQLTAGRVRRRDRDFPAYSTQAGFDEAMCYFHVDRAIAYLETLGFRGERRIFSEPLRVNAHGTRDDNSWYSPQDRSLTFGTGDVDDAEDGETILHELGHALQDAICPDFGQSAQAAAMGEGFGDYFAGSFFAERKPRAYRATVMSWDGLYYGGDPPCLRRLDDPRSYESFDHGRNADEHENGQIWSATLWEARRALGRQVADRLVVESHFQLDPFTTFARGARAIIDADRNLYEGAHAARLKNIFRRRGIGPVD